MSAVRIDVIELQTGQHNIQIAIDRPPTGKDKDRPVVVIPPAFNKTMRDYFLLSMYFVYNDFMVVRYDNINHLGRSSGNIYDFTLTDCLYTLEQVTRFVKQEFRNPVCALATSLMARVMIKHMTSSEANLYQLVGLLLPVVNVNYTIDHIVELDLFEREIAGNPVHEVDILGNRVNSDRFVRDAILKGFHSLTSTIDDLSKVRHDVMVFAAPGDEWVKYEDVLMTFSAYAGARRFVALENSSHQLDRNLLACKQLFREVVANFTSTLHSTKRQLNFPSFKEIVANSRIDREKEDVFSRSIVA